MRQSINKILVWLACALAGVILYSCASINMIRSGRSPLSACINNLRQIDAAKEQWGMEHNKKAEDTPTREDLKGYLGRGTGKMPSCPKGGIYTINCLSNAPQCTVNGHVLPTSP